MQNEACSLSEDLFYPNSDDHHNFAVKQIAEEERLVEELGLKDD